MDTRCPVEFRNRFDMTTANFDIRRTTNFFSLVVSLLCDGMYWCRLIQPYLYMYYTALDTRREFAFI